MADTLMELSGEYLQLFNMLMNTDPDDEERQIIEDSLESITGALEVKADGYVAVIDKLNSEAAVRKQMADKLAKAAKVLENHASRMKDRLKYCMESMGKTELKSRYFTFKIVNNGGKQTLKIRDGVEVPESYKRIILENDNDKIRKTLESGETLPFAYLEERGTHLRIS